MKPRHAPSLPLTPAMKFVLMVGQFPPCRLPGWVVLEQSVVRTPTGLFDYTPAGDRHWAAHAPALTVEAKAHGFTPYWATKVDPTGPDFRRWRDAFLREHEY